MAHIVIDGYNLIRRSETLSAIDARNLERGRSALLHRLVNYREQKGHAITVVFDATHSTHVEMEKERVGDIEVLYSAQGKTADEMLIRIARHFGPRIIMVTSDREILNAAKGASCGCLTSDEFLVKLKKVGAPLAAPSRESSQDADNRPIHKRWITKKKGPAKRLSKEKRKALARLD